ncbi:TlpA family protein disulfide reductase [Rhodanobacter sp. Col0626]|uniref:TlpA family protein disulfide reductase n=1 Tax=Rhodanobacter sp. Col0626 TaxID=3415679 RepID=UPI003CF6CB65
MLSRSNWLILGFAVLAAVIGGYIEHRHQTASADFAAPAMVGQALPAITLPDLDGKPHQLAEYRGRRVVLNFWASWCVPCLEEMPALTRVQEKFGEHAPIVIGIAMDEPVRVRAFLAAHPVNYPILLGHLAWPSTSEQLGNARQILPYSVLIDADGRILATHEGPLTARLLQEWQIAESE